jgi:hypothetical protein
MSTNMAKARTDALVAIERCRADGMFDQEQIDRLGPLVDELRDRSTATGPVAPPGFHLLEGWVRAACDTCGAVIATVDYDRHLEWHRR